MHLTSDNTGPAHPKILEALGRANASYAKPYGAEAAMDQVRRRIRELFEAPDAAVYLVATGTAANSITLATLARPWETIFCSPVAHIHEDECGCPEFFTGGSKLTLVGTDDRIAPADLLRAIEAEETRGVHGQQRGPIAITQATERGSVYDLDEIAAICDVAKQFGLSVYMDGARFANALVELDCSPAEMTWKAGVDALSFGATKNGAIGVEAVILFDPEKAWEFELRRKRSAHLFSKHRFLSAQMSAYLQDDLWLELSRRANASRARLQNGLSLVEAVEVLGNPRANMVFAYMPRSAHKRLHDAGAEYYLWSGALTAGPDSELLLARMVCDWSISDDAIDQFVGIIAN